MAKGQLFSRSERAWYMDRAWLVYLGTFIWSPSWTVSTGRRRGSGNRQVSIWILAQGSTNVAQILGVALFAPIILAKVGEGNGTPLQYSCLENPMDGGAWWAAVHGVTKSWDMTEQLHFDFSLSCIGEANGNPFQRSCLENPRDGGAWWAARLWGRAESDTTEAT